MNSELRQIIVLLSNRDREGAFYRVCIISRVLKGNIKMCHVFSIRFFHVSITGCNSVSKTSKLVLKTKQTTFLCSLRNINTVIFNIKKKSI